MKEIMEFALMTLGGVFVVIMLLAGYLLAKESMEEKFDKKVNSSLRKITGKTWSYFDNPIRELEESFEEFEEATSDEISRLWIRTDNLRRENERQYKVLKEAIKKLEDKEVNV